MRAGVGVGKFSPTPTPNPVKFSDSDRLRLRLRSPARHYLGITMFDSACNTIGDYWLRAVQFRLSDDFCSSD